MTVPPPFPEGPLNISDLTGPGPGHVSLTPGDPVPERNPRPPGGKRLKRRAPSTATDDPKRIRARELCEAGWTRGRIAEEFGVAPTTISNWAKKDGWEFPRNPGIVAAREATLYDAALVRKRLMQKAYAAAELAVEAFNSEYTVYQWGKEGFIATDTLKHPPARERQALMTAFGIAAQRAYELEKYESMVDNTDAAVDNFMEHVTDDAANDTTPILYVVEDNKVDDSEELA